MADHFAVTKTDPNSRARTGRLITAHGEVETPAFMQVGGKETIVGVTSFGDVNCAQGGYDTKVDAESAFIDGYVNMFDPGFLTGSGGAGKTRLQWEPAALRACIPITPQGQGRKTQRP